MRGHAAGRSRPDNYGVVLFAQINLCFAHGPLLPLSLAMMERSHYAAMP
jgi:hypothetical protein